MNQENHTPPGFKEGAFNCPQCHAYAHQNWRDTYILMPRQIYTEAPRQPHTQPIQYIRNQYTKFEILNVAFCENCRKPSFWVRGKLVYPPETTAPLAHQGMPEDVSEYYNEAREISAASPRAAAALLRIAAKKLCEFHRENEPILNLAIGNLKKKGLPEEVIQSLDTVRILGNEGAHAGKIDLNGQDNKEIVDRLFWLINYIVEKTITEPATIKNVFESLPESKRQAVKQRDKGK